jgi:hypothetical protein
MCLLDIYNNNNNNNNNNNALILADLFDLLEQLAPLSIML